MLERLEGANDRLLEAHFFLHGLERNYHFASPFRWHLNAFLRPLSEIPNLVSRAVQHSPTVVEWHRVAFSDLSSDPLISHLRGQRNFVVHHDMLLPSSSASFGITEGRGMKIGIGGPSLSPRMDSDVAMVGVARSLREDGDFLGILAMDDEDSLPAIERRWALARFPDTELVDLCAKAWLKVGSYFRSVLDQVGNPVSPPSLDCRHNSNAVRIRAYDRGELRRGVIRPVLM